MSKVYVVRVDGFMRTKELAELKRKFEEELGGKVIVVDDFVQDVFALDRTDVEMLVEIMDGSIEWKDADGAECQAD